MKANNIHTGYLRKMYIITDNPVRYHLSFDHGNGVCLNEYLGNNIALHFTLEISCVGCTRKITKSFNQGYCYPCFKKLARCDSCIIKPELCHFATGTCREPEWGLSHCMQPHIVYLSQTSNIKVGVTRRTNMPARWFDQGATQALPIIATQKRLHAGLIEVELAKAIADKTNWRKMLQGDAEDVDLHAYASHLLQAENIQALLANQSLWQDQQPQLITNHQDMNITYPVLEYPVKIRSHNPEKTPTIEGKLLGMKGQYLILDTGVLNLRKYTGYFTEITLDP